MKKLIIALGCVALIFAFSAPSMAKNDKKDCTTIQDGVIEYSAGHYLAGDPISTGFDVYGYNYQGHMFSGSYTNSYLGGAGFPVWQGDDVAYIAANPTVVSHWAWPYRDVELIMKWSDEWISNTDCNFHGSLDRHWGFVSYIGSGAWLTNHQRGTYDGEDGKKCKWTYFVKIVAAPSDAETVAGVWYTADGTEIGPVIWGAFAIIQQVENDPCAGIHGIQYLSPDHAGLGNW